MIWIIIIITVAMLFLFIQSKKPVYTNEPEPEPYVHRDFRTEAILRNIEYMGDPAKEVGDFTIDVKGLFYRTKKAQLRACELAETEILFLEIDNRNQHDKNAIKVKTFDDIFIGYVDEFYSKKVRQMIDSNFEIDCFVSSVSLDDIPYVSMQLYYSGNKQLI